MKKIIKGHTYDTDTAKQLAFKYVGNFGDAHGYEERLYITKMKQYFVFGTGGPESPYPEPTIKPITQEHADEWEKETSEDKTPCKEKEPAKAKETKTKKPRKPAAKKSAKVVEPVKEAEVSADIENPAEQ